MKTLYALGRILSLTLCCCLLAPAAHAEEQLDVRAAILMDMNTGKVLYEQNADEPIPPASLTKVLTMLMAFERMAEGKASLDAPVKISRAAAGTRGSRMGLKPYESVPLEQLLLGMAVSSGNDATAAVAEYLGGSQQDFVALMNQKAQQLGMRNSFFCNPHGLPAAGQVTTARDMLALSYQYLQSFPQALRFHSTRYMRHNGSVTYNKNPLLNNYDGADGLKTGWVRASGYNLISTVEQNGTRLLAVILGAENSNIRGRETYRILEAGFTVAKAPEQSVAEVLPNLSPTDYAVNIKKTANEAYAVLAPESLGKAPTKKSVRTQKARKGSKTVQQARKGSKTEQGKNRKSRDTQAASLARRNG